MNIPQALPSFDDCFPDLNRFVLELVRAYEAGKIKSWADLDERVRAQLGDGDVESTGYFDQYRDAVNRPHTPLHLREPALRPAEEPS